MKFMAPSASHKYFGQLRRGCVRPKQISRFEEGGKNSQTPPLEKGRGGSHHKKWCDHNRIFNTKFCSKLPPPRLCGNFRVLGRSDFEKTDIFSSEIFWSLPQRTHQADVDQAKADHRFLDEAPLGLHHDQEELHRFEPRETPPGYDGNKWRVWSEGRCWEAAGGGAT